MKVIKKEEFLDDLAIRISLQQAIRDNTIEAVPLDKVKNAREEIANKIHKDPYMHFTLRQRERNEAFMEVLDILDKLIAESEVEE